MCLFLSIPMQPERWSITHPHPSGGAHKKIHNLLYRLPPSIFAKGKRVGWWLNWLPESNKNFLRFFFRFSFIIIANRLKTNNEEFSLAFVAKTAWEWGIHTLRTLKPFHSICLKRTQKVRAKKNTIAKKVLCENFLAKAPNRKLAFPFHQITDLAVKGLCFELDKPTWSNSKCMQNGLCSSCS